MAKNTTDREIAELRHNFSEYLKPQGKKSYSTTVTDSFYLYNNGHQIEFFELLQIENIQEFQQMAYELLQKTLSERSSKKGENISNYIKCITLLWKYLHNDTSAYVAYKHRSDLSVAQNISQIDVNKQHNKPLLTTDITSPNSNEHIPRPSCAEVDRFLTLWNTTPAYHEPDKVLKELFTQTHPHNTSIDEIILKAAALNTVYNTRITSIYPVAQCILSLNIDERLRDGDETLVNAIVSGFAEKGVWKHYSFVTKYCSFHNPDAYPIYDSYVAKILWHYQQAENFSSFEKNFRTLDSFVDNVLKKDYVTFKRIIAEFRRHFGLEKYSTKEFDQYLWQLGKACF